MGIQASNSTVSCSNIHKKFEDAGKSVIVLEGLSLEVDKGESVAIIGRSGSGKTTLLNILGGLELPTSGEVNIAGNRVSGLSEAKRTHLRNYYLGFIFQSHHLLPEFTALENVCMPLLIRGMKPRNMIEIGKSFLTKVGLSDRMDHKPSMLSGGERQRVAIARALVTEPKCILADEPTGNLDDRNTNQIYDLMVTITKEVGTSFIVVTHDLNLAKRMNRQLLLEHGQLKPVNV